MSDKSGEPLKIAISAFSGAAAFFGVLLVGTEGGQFLIREDYVPVDYSLLMATIIVLVGAFAARTTYRGVRSQLG